MSSLDIDRSRGAIENPVPKEDVGRFLLDVLNNLGYSELNVRQDSEDKGIQYLDNRSLWEDIDTQKIYEGKYISLQEFHLTEWIPLSPGTYYLPESEDRRLEAKEWVSDTGEYLPQGKGEMVLSGIGSIRLSSKPLNSKRYFFLGATSTGVTHQGIPIAVINQDYESLRAKLKEYGGCLCNISGFIEVMPKSISVINYRGKVPKYYLLANKIGYIEPSQNNILSSSIAIMFQSYNSYQSSPYLEKKWSYCSFKPSHPESLEKAINWLKDYTMRYEDNPIILNDFDEYYDYFSDPVEFPLKLLTQGVIDKAKITPYLKQYNIQIHTKNIVMGDLFENISNATIINKALVLDSFNKVKGKYDDQISKALLQVAGFIEKAENPAAAVLFDTFNQELNKPQPEKSKLKNIWSGIQKILPTVATVSDASAKIPQLFT